MFDKFSYKRAVAAFATALTVQVALPRKTEANPLAIPAVAGCTASVVCAVGTVLIGGILYYTVTWRGQSPQYFPVDGSLGDPEQEYESVATGSGPTNGASRETLRKRCEYLAQQMGGVFREVRINSRGTMYYCLIDIPR